MRSVSQGARLVFRGSVLIVLRGIICRRGSVGFVGRIV